jgi:hypothetical protein
MAGFNLPPLLRLSISKTTFASSRTFFFEQPALKMSVLGPLLQGLLPLRIRVEQELFRIRWPAPQLNPHFLKPPIT